MPKSHELAQMVSTLEIYKNFLRLYSGLVRRYNAEKTYNFVSFSFGLITSEAFLKSSRML